MRKALFQAACGFALFTLSAVLPAGSEELPTPWPETCQEAVDKLITVLSNDDKSELRVVPKDDLILYHHGWGTAIRNEFGLWSGNVSLAEDCHARFGQSTDPEPLHPDTISMLIIGQVWIALQE